MTYILAKPLFTRFVTLELFDFFKFEMSITVWVEFIRFNSFFERQLKSLPRIPSLSECFEKHKTITWRSWWTTLETAYANMERWLTCRTDCFMISGVQKSLCKPKSNCTYGKTHVSWSCQSPQSTIWRSILRLSVRSTASICWRDMYEGEIISSTTKEDLQLKQCSCRLTLSLM